MTKNVQECKISHNLSAVPLILTFGVGECSRRSLKQRLICVVLPLFGFAKLEALVCNTTHEMCDFRQVSKRFPRAGSSGSCMVIGNFLFSAITQTKMGTCYGCLSAMRPVKQALRFLQFSVFHFISRDCNVCFTGFAFPIV